MVDLYAIWIVIVGLIEMHFFHREATVLKQ